MFISILPTEVAVQDIIGDKCGVAVAVNDYALLHAPYRYHCKEHCTSSIHVLRSLEHPALVSMPVSTGVHAANG